MDRKKDPVKNLDKSRMHGYVSPIALAAVLLTAGCDDDSVSGTGEAVDRTRQPLSSGSIQSVNGTFGGDCTDRGGNWSAEVAPGAPLDYAPLDVVLNDTGCVLTVTALRMASEAIAATPSIELQSEFKNDASSFGSEFYANAKLSDVDFDDDFTITILYSEDPNLVNGGTTVAAFEVVSSSAAAVGVDAPDYALNPAGIDILTDADNLIVSVSGHADLTEGIVLGQTYVVSALFGNALDTYGEIDAEYLAHSDALLPGASGGIVEIPAAAFFLSGPLPQKRTLIIANTYEDVPSYEALEITFAAAE
jgi:hypothetical protein